MMELFWQWWNLLANSHTQILKLQTSSVVCQMNINSLTIAPNRNSHTWASGHSSRLQHTAAVSQRPDNRKTERFTTYWQGRSMRNERSELSNEGELFSCTNTGVWIVVHHLTFVWLMRIISLFSEPVHCYDLREGLFLACSPMRHRRKSWSGSARRMQHSRPIFKRRNKQTLKCARIWQMHKQRCLHC